MNSQEAALSPLWTGLILGDAKAGIRSTITSEYLIPVFFLRGKERLLFSGIPGSSGFPPVLVSANQQRQRTSSRIGQPLALVVTRRCQRFDMVH
jgi:hypothetical protein